MARRLRRNGSQAKNVRAGSARVEVTLKFSVYVGLSPMEASFVEQGPKSARLYRPDVFEVAESVHDWACNMVGIGEWEDAVEKIKVKEILDEEENVIARPNTEFDTYHEDEDE